MSKNHRNNHYHYAEKFEDRRRHSSKKTAFMPFKSVVISLVVLLMFGFVSITFASYVSEDASLANADVHPIISEVRNLRATREIAVTGADGEFASTGATWSFSGTSYMYFETSWTDSHIMLLIGKSDYTSVYEMSKVTGTNYYVVQLPSSGWGDASYMCVIGASSTWGSGSWGSGNRTNAPHYTNTYTSGLSASNNQRYEFSSGSSNNSSLSLSYLGTSNDNLKKVTLNAKAAYSANGSTYSAGSTGGTVKITSYYFNAYNTITSSSAGPGDDESFDAARATENSQFTASAATGYRFVGWYDSLNNGNLVSGSATYNYQTTSGNKTLYARFIKRVTVTVSQYPSRSIYSGDSPTVGGSTTSQTVDIGTAVTLNANVSTGINAVWKSGSSSGTTVLSSASGSYTPTADVTLYACYSLTAPTFTSYSYTSPITVGQSSTLNKNISSATGSDSGLTYTYTAAAYGTTASDPAATSSSWSFDSSGNFTPTIPGQYKITVSVKDKSKGLTSASVSRDTAIVTVKPTKPTSVEFEYDSSYDGSGTVADPFMLPVNDTSFYIKSYIPVADRDSAYTYNWSRTDGRYVLATGAITAGSGSVSTTGDDGNGVTDTASASSATTTVIHNAMLGNTEGYAYKVAVSRVRNGVSSDVNDDLVIYYTVTNNFLRVESFDFSSYNSSDTIQKIYDEDNTIDHIDASYDAGGNQFKTMLWYSANNIDFSEVAAWFPNTFKILSGATPNPDPSHDYSALPNDAAHKVSVLIESLSTIARNNVNLMKVTGPKWFRGYVADENDNYANPSLHTTVGTSSTVANRPIYYVDATANEEYTKDCRVMAFYTRETDTPVVHYQTAQLVKSNTYRFYIPSDAVKITFAHVAKSSYVLPTYNATGGNLTYSYGSNVLKAWTQTLDLISSDNAGMTAFKADTKGTPSSGVYNYTNTSNNGHMTTLD